MRAFLNAILEFIGVSTLTDEEYENLDLEIEIQNYSAENYAALLAVLDAREAVSGARDRLEAYFIARGTEVSTPSRGTSNILIGDTLED